VKKALDSSKVEDALNRFERYESKIDGLESQVEAYDLGKKSLSDEIADLQKNEQVDDELAALKKKLANKE
jgi:phage shock protein A